LHIPKRINYLAENQTGIVKINFVQNTEPYDDFGLLDYSEMFEELISDSNNSLYFTRHKFQQNNYQNTGTSKLINFSNLLCTLN